MARQRSSSAGFTATVSAITDAFGDPTRRSIYLFARDAEARDGRGVTASEVADEVGVHANVARRHLDKLAAGGYLAVGVEKGLKGRVGRPSKRYRPAAEPRDAVPVHTDDLALVLLGRMVSAMPADQAEMVAEEVGVDYGRSLAAALSTDGPDQEVRSIRSAVQAVVDALTAHGFAARAVRQHDRFHIINQNCPFGDLAAEHPVLCAVDRGLVRGMLSGLTADECADVAVGSSRADGDSICSTLV
ncbi:MAG: hypothetical protein CSA55_02760 [Ilumatobacter coccineus]|uniref:Helix-turn-helix domain-containing protein n=1 Tax=Ilumatobacter coccineus TaxID=467094 RepID=A0A2G6KB88_9ACTN|nr:MAG: hypothetical protein CSA55_02760 [Ilumatobacter coccineus]